MTELLTKDYDDCFIRLPDITMVAYKDTDVSLFLRNGFVLKTKMKSKEEAYRYVQ